jgi:hypothetical protein
VAEIQRQRIKSVYGEIKGIFQALPTGSNTLVPTSVAQHYNSAVDELSQVSETDYGRLKISRDDLWDAESNDNYDPIAVRAKVSALMRRLEEEHGFGASEQTSTSAPVIVTVNQNQQVTVSVTPIQEIIDSTSNEDIKAELAELKDALENKKDAKQASSILSTIQAKSWEVFIKVLPYVLEHLGHTPHH